VQEAGVSVLKITSQKRPSPAALVSAATRQTVDFAAYCAVRLLIAVIQTLPLDMGDTICRGLAWLVTGPLRIRHQVTEHNLERVFPDSDARSREQLDFAMWHHLLLMVCEIAWAQRRLHLTNWSQHVTFRQNRQILRYMLDTRPVLTVTDHFGNFEIGGYITGLMGVNTLTIARQLDNRFIHRWVERFRGAKGQHMVDKDGCANEVNDHLEQGGILALLADQYAGPKGCWVDFLGVPASCHKALALFSLGSQAPMLVGVTRRIDGRPMQFEMSCAGVADPANDTEGVCGSVQKLTQWYCDRLGSSVGQSVEQYWWLHRRWRTPPEKAVRLMKKRAAA
jgi:KDO2-lipid IV(A) lauroyltransferase